MTAFDRRPLGSSGRDVSVMSLGSWRTSETMPGEQGAAIMRAARDAWKHCLDDARIDTGHDLLRVDGVHDVFGDGAVTCIPTPGHTCGHQPLRVSTADGPVIVAGHDAAVFERLASPGRTSR